MEKHMLNWDDVLNAATYNLYYKDGENPEVLVGNASRPFDLLTLNLTPTHVLSISIAPVSVNSSEGLRSTPLTWEVPLPAPVNVRLE